MCSKYLRTIERARCLQMTRRWSHVYFDSPSPSTLIKFPGVAGNLITTDTLLQRAGELNFTQLFNQAEIGAIAGEPRRLTEGRLRKTFTMSDEVSRPQTDRSRFIASRMFPSLNHLQKQLSIELTSERDFSRIRLTEVTWRRVMKLCTHVGRYLLSCLVIDTWVGLTL